jgi:hypothetical protein
MDSSLDESWNRYLFEYRHQGTEWALEVRARDLNDAKARLETLPFATFIGEIELTGSFPIGEPNRPPTSNVTTASVNSRLNDN